MTTKTKGSKDLALEYLDAVARKDLARVRALLAPDLRFRGPAVARSTADDYVTALKRLGAIHLHNEVRKVFADGDDVCVIYDFVTDTPAGALRTIEWLRIEDGLIRSIDLYYDRLPWKGVMDELARRTAQVTA
jgi:ketosteroid isomerase-like protein